MCGIAGMIDEFHSLENQYNTFKKMIASMKHRGPTDDGMHVEDHIALLHARLAITDDEKGKQPMHYKQYIIVYNGECYNTDDLKNDLSEKGYEFKTTCDTEVVLKMYAHYKEKCLDLIEGIFSFAIYDTNEKTLFLARDPMGVKPLFYTFVDNIFLFASEMKTLFAHPEVLPILDEHGIHQIAYLGPGRIEGSGVFKNIYELKGGEYGIYSKDGFHIHSYFELSNSKHKDDYPTTIQKVKEMIADSIEKQLISDKRLGCLLSGGLDSSIIVSIASKYYEKQKKKLSTFSLEFESNEDYFSPNFYQPSNDVPYIDLMVKKFNTNHTVIKLSNQDLLDALYKSVDARDLPGMADIDSSLLCFCEKLKEHVDVILSGECADEIFGGYPWYKEFNTTFPWMKNLDYRNSILNECYQIDYKQYISELYHSSITKAPIHEDDTNEDIAYKQLMYLHLHWFMQTLIDRKDRMCMANSLEARVPYCNPKIIDYVYSIPTLYKNKDSQEKSILREAMKDYLPVEILERKKSPFPKTYHPDYLRALRTELLKLRNHEPVWKIFNRNEALKLCTIESDIPWYGQLMKTPQTIAYLLQVNYWLKKYEIIIQ